MAFVAIAAKTNQEPTEDDQAKIWFEFNTKPEYHPKWRQVTEEFYFTVVRYESANIDVDPLTGLSTLFKNGRMIGDGIVLHHNTPTLWDQGTIVTAQFPTDCTDVESFVTRIPLDIDVPAMADTIITPSNPCTIQISYPSPSGALVISSITITSMVTTYQSPAITADYHATWYLWPEGGNDELTIGSTVKGTPFQFAAYCEGNVSGQTTIIVFIAAYGRPPFNFPFRKNAAFALPGNGVTNVLDPSGGTLVRSCLWTAPTLSTAGLVQIDPKYNAELMKNQQGVYMVRHPDQPVLQVKDWAKVSPIKAIRPNMSSRVAQLNSTDNIDVIDLNQNTYVISVRGISYAAQPFVKMNRFYEATTTSKEMAVMMRETPEVDEVAMMTYFAFSQSAPHSYPPAMNFLGGLLSVITGAIQMIPVFLRGAKAIGQGVVGAVQWAEEHILPGVETVGKFLG